MPKTSHRLLTLVLVATVAAGCAANVSFRKGQADEVAGVLQLCRDAGVHVTIQGGRTSLVAGTVPEHDDLLLSTERLSAISDVDTTERRIEAGAGATLAAVQRAAGAAGLVFGVDLAARDTATVGGMASTNAGGLRTVRYGNMGNQIKFGGTATFTNSIVVANCWAMYQPAFGPFTSNCLAARTSASTPSSRCLLDCAGCFFGNAIRELHPE